MGNMMPQFWLRAPGYRLRGGYGLRRAHERRRHLADPNTNPIERSIGLKNWPKFGDVTLLWTSRSADAPKML